MRNNFAVSPEQYTTLFAAASRTNVVMYFLFDDVLFLYKLEKVYFHHLTRISKIQILHDSTKKEFFPYLVKLKNCQVRGMFENARSA